uniref:Si:ch211-226m7.4 n=1 Tax=Oncorhynchus mykiss TaxID=8022 RepID=A0A8C7RMF6_ONCMY
MGNQEKSYDKWTQPGWRIEQKYANNVLIGNWVEEKFQGLPAKLLLSHHGTLPSHYLVTLYDEMYGRQGTSTLPPLRSWHPDRLAWTPEKSDHPSLAPPTNFGLVESRQVRLDQQQSPLPALSVYRSAYQKYPLSAFCQPRFASVPRGHSSKLHPANRINKDMDLKQRPCRQVPDNSVSASLLPPLSVV